MDKYLMKTIGLVGILLLIASCGGSSSSSPTEEDSATITTLSEVPDSVLNPQAYDLTTQSASVSAPLDKGLFKAVGVGGFSRAGCETNEMKKNVIRNAILPRMILCNIKAFETAAGGVAAGSGTFNYWKMSPPEGEQGPAGVDEFAPRVAIKLDGNVFTFVMCNGATKTMELYIDTTGNVYNGHVIDKWGEGFDGKLEFSADGLPPDDFTSATFTQYFVEASNYFSGYGSATLEATPTYNIVQGFHSGTAPDNGGTFSGATYAKFDINDGTAKYRMDSGSFPGQTVEEVYNYCKAHGECAESNSADEWIDPVNGWLVNGDPCSLDGLTVESVLCFRSEDCPTVADENGLCDISTGETYTESFTINNADPLNLVFAMADTSTYAADVAAADAPSSAISPTIEFTSASADIDCSTSDSWTELTFSSEPDMTECIAMQEELDDWQAGDVCANQESQNGAASAQ